MRAKSLQLCPTLHDLIDRSSPGSSVRGILQVRKLGRIAMLSSRAETHGNTQMWTLRCRLTNCIFAGMFLHVYVCDFLSTWASVCLNYADVCRRETCGYTV